MVKPAPPKPSPIRPKNCSGRSRKLTRNLTVIRSKKTFRTRDSPYLDLPRWRTMLEMGISQILKPSRLMRAGMKRCSSP